MSFSHAKGIRVGQDGTEEVEDLVAREYRLRLNVNGKYFCDMIATLDQLRELGAGFVICEGISPKVDEVTVRGEEIFVECSSMQGGGCEIGTSGGVSVETPSGRVDSGLTISREDVTFVTRHVESELWRQTGGVHCSVLFRDGELIAKSADVGRHNTVDKVVGTAVLAGIDLPGCVLGCTGRQPAGMVVKAARAGIPVVISRAATTDRGIAAAEAAGITLICFSRNDRFTIYSNPWRVTGIGSGRKV
ncbi:MAG: formate dehydrogenase accessory sulfurtransferase FdhD [Methanoregulaceae archaeon]|nr:formate dehydrogenase accessory sulfurtransferase FdhD [Methanoregulaceae archaeon]